MRPLLDDIMSEEKFALLMGDGTFDSGLLPSAAP